MTSPGKMYDAAFIRRLQHFVAAIMHLGAFAHRKTIALRIEPPLNFDRSARCVTSPAARGQSVGRRAAQLKRFRRIATRWDVKSANFFGFLQLAASVLILRALTAKGWL